MRKNLSYEEAYEELGFLPAWIIRDILERIPVTSRKAKAATTLLRLKVDRRRS